jgi:dihydroorotate dehydrogenase
MSGFYRHVIRPVLFRQESEVIHDRTLQELSRVGRSTLLTKSLETIYGAPPLPVTVFGVDFPNPVGLAAGMDKHASAVPVWAAMGFGFSELGGVTRHAQPGNPSPRMFRLPRMEALINRMGFNNDGAEAMALKLREWRSLKRWPNHPIGINLGKSKITPLEEAPEDYLFSFRALRDLADFFVVNVSSPNTPNLRQLQDKSALNEILSAIQEENLRSEKPRPILVKVAPDLSFTALDEILELAGPRRLAGIVASNTTVARPGSDDPREQKILAETGGLSGRPLKTRSTEIIAHLHRQTGGKMALIGVGGIFNANDAWEKIRVGATLVQVYTGLVYEGPGMVRGIIQGLRKRMEREGFNSIHEVVGTGNTK